MCNWLCTHRPNMCISMRCIKFSCWRNSLMLGGDLAYDHPNLSSLNSLLIYRSNNCCTVYDEEKADFFPQEGHFDLDKGTEWPQTESKHKHNKLPSFIIYITYHLQKKLEWTTCSDILVIFAHLLINCFANWNNDSFKKKNLLPTAFLVGTLKKSIMSSVGLKVWSQADIKLQVFA